MAVIDSSFEADDTPQTGFAALAWLFLRAACSSFGGNMAMISSVQHTLVERRKLLTHQDLLDGISLASMLPGPMAVNVVAYAGYRLRGTPGAVVAMCAALAPAFILMLLFGFAYLQWAHHPLIGKAFAAVVPAVAAIVLVAGRQMWRHAIAGWREATLALGAATALICVSRPWISVAVIAVSALAGLLLMKDKAGPATVTNPVAAFTALETLPTASSLSRMETCVLTLVSISGLAGLFSTFNALILPKLFVVFASMSLMLFGGAYVFIPLMQHMLIDGHHWLTQQQFVDALAIAQLMPGPVIVVATFIGFKLAGLPGAVIATFAIVAPSAAIMLACTQMLDRIRASRPAMAALHGVRAAVAGMIFASAILILKNAAPGALAILTGTAALVALLRYRIEPVWIVLSAALVGLLTA